MTNTALVGKLEKAQRLALDLMNQHGLLAGGWAFKFNKAKVSAGVCRYPTGNRPGCIELSAFFVAANPEAEVLDTILHEISHALAGRAAGHGWQWKAVCLRVGARPVRCYDGSVRMPAGAYKAVCPGCGRTHSRHRKPRAAGRYHCLPCGPAQGPLTFSRSH